MITERLNQLKGGLNPTISLVAVSKTKPAEQIMEAYQTGHRDFGENKVQELVQKYETLPSDIRWHMIGHLQSNKVKYIASFIHLIHSVDSLKILSVINKEAKKNNRCIDFLFQVKIAKEESKFGLSAEKLHEILHTKQMESFNNVRLAGLMGMASYSTDPIAVKKEFAQIKQLFDKLQSGILKNNPDFKILSTGMSHDYEHAIACGSTMVRIGSKIFGERIYSN